MSKYDSLTRHLEGKRLAEVPMHFDEVESVLGFPLPRSARKYRPWWSNESEGSHVQARAWLRAGYKVRDVDMASERLMFVRLNATPVPDVRAGDHPLWGAMQGTITILDDAALTRPGYNDDELDGFTRDLATLVRNGKN